MTGRIRTLWHLMHSQRLRYAAAVVALGISVLLLYLSPLVVRTAIDGVLRNEDSFDFTSYTAQFIQIVEAADYPARALAIAGLCVVALTVLGGVFVFLRGRWSAIASEHIACDLRNRLYDHLQHVPCAYHDSVQTGDLVQRCTSDVDTVCFFYSTQVLEIVRAILLLLTALPILLILDWQMTLVAVSLVPVIVVSAIVFFRKVQASFKAIDEAEGALTTVLHENLTGIRVVRAFARHDFEHRKFTAKNTVFRDLNYRLVRLMAIYWSASDLVCFAQAAIVLFAGALWVSQGRITVGTLVAFISYVGMMIWPVRQMGRILAEVGKAMVSLTRIQEILAQPRETGGGMVPAGLPGRVKGHIAFNNVCFSYGEKAILHNITLSIPAGQTIAIVGPSGAGKSTLANLLLRFYDYSSGSITLDGHELKHLDRKYVRRQFGIVMQEPFLFSKTVRDNIALGHHNADDHDVVAAASAAAVHESIENFDKQYHTFVGERGVTLSGGQRQRVAIARALLPELPILILDDALSAVDTRTESLILNALKARHSRYTTLIIAHRLSTLMHADRIIVLDHGRVIQAGTHLELIAQPGLYRRLYRIQSALEKDLARELTAQPVAAPSTDDVTAA